MLVARGVDVPAGEEVEHRHLGRLDRLDEQREIRPPPAGALFAKALEAAPIPIVGQPVVSGADERRDAEHHDVHPELHPDLDDGQLGEERDGERAAEPPEERLDVERGRDIVPRERDLRAQGEVLLAAGVLVVDVVDVLLADLDGLALVALDAVVGRLDTGRVVALSLDGLEEPVLDVLDGVARLDEDARTDREVGFLGLLGEPADGPVGVARLPRGAPGEHAVEEE